MKEKMGRDYRKASQGSIGLLLLELLADLRRRALAQRPRECLSSLMDWSISSRWSK